MNKQIKLWKVQPSLIVDFGSKLPEQVDLQDMYIAASSCENTISLVNSLIIGNKVCQSFIRAIYSLSDDLCLGNHLKEMSDQNDNALALLNGEPARLYKIILKEEGLESSLVEYAISDSMAHAVENVSLTISGGAAVDGCEMLSRKVFFDRNSPIVEFDTKADLPESENSLLMLLGSEEQNHPILQNQTQWFRIIDTLGGKTWGQRYINALSNLGIKTVSDLALSIMALKLEALKPQRFGIPFRFVNKMPNGESLTIKSDFGGYAWEGVLKKLSEFGFQWREYVTNKDQLAFYEESRPIN